LRETPEIVPGGETETTVLLETREKLMPAWRSARRESSMIFVSICTWALFSLGLPRLAAPTVIA
jgi:hypothetical protein